MSDKLIKKTKNIPKPTNFGENLKLLRRLHGHSQQALANQVGLSRNNIASYESGVVEPNSSNFLKICTFFEVDPKDLLTTVIAENPIDNIAITPGTESLTDNVVKDQLEQFIMQTNEMTKVYEGYKTFFEMRQLSAEYKEYRALYSTLEDLLDLLNSLIASNWSLIQSIYPTEEE